MQFNKFGLSASILYAVVFALLGTACVTSTVIDSREITLLVALVSAAVMIALFAHLAATKAVFNIIAQGRATATAKKISYQHKKLRLMSELFAINVNFDRLNYEYALLFEKYEDLIHKNGVLEERVRELEKMLG